ncbi:hypothetical protein AWV80_03030 [Cupriavidus sp. UYMU48A]|nr:hypothetical protein AWV80_03030 [Cupriavidus sp. UYMU48A]
MITLAQSCRRESDGTLVCAQTQFGMIADYVLAGTADGLLLLDCSGAERIGTGVHGSQCATLRWRPASPSSRFRAPHLRRPGLGRRPARRADRRRRGARRRDDAAVLPGPLCSSARRSASTRRSSTSSRS